jgi:RNA polymerase sigma-70 factor, ECF subfamily
MEHRWRHESVSARPEREKLGVSANPKQLGLDKYDRIEDNAHKACANNDYDAAATIFIQHCGPEILGYILGRLSNEGDAAEVFSEFAEDFWRGLPSFEWRSSLRTWAYALARNAAYRFKKDPVRRPERNVPISQDTRFGQSVAHLRETTLKWRRTEMKSKIRLLRERLSDDEQTLLVLRVDRQLSWRDLAIVMSGQTGKLDETELARWSTNLRQRFKKIKERLRKFAQEEGLLDSTGSASAGTPVSENR